MVVLLAWRSLDCLLTSLPITPLSRSSIIMRSNGNPRMSDSHHRSPQTTSSSGYHSDLSSAISNNESPQSLHEILSANLEKSSSSSSTSHSQKKTISVTNNSTCDKSLTNRNLSRISSFIRKQYQRAKSKLISKPSLPPPPSSSSSLTSQAPAATIKTCSKATSTTPLTYLSEDNFILINKQKQNSICSQNLHYHQHHVSSAYPQSSLSEPVYSINVQPLYNHQLKLTSQQRQNYAPIHECYSHQPSYRHSTTNNYHQYSSSYRRLATMANFENHNYNKNLYHYYPIESLSSSSCQNYYPYRYTNNNYNYNRFNYVSLSDFITTKSSAFKPIGQKQKQFHQRPSYDVYEQISPSDDPCDLEVAQYFTQTSHWSNPNYFDIYSNDISIPKQNYVETLC